MDLRKLILVNNNCYKAGVTMKPKGVMWHSTGANNPKLSRYVGPDDGLLGVNKAGNHWNTAKPGGRSVCVHAFIGKDKNGNIATYQTLPWNMRGWHAGGSANDNYIGFEICEDALTDKAYFNKVYKEAVELTAHLCKLYGLDPMGKNVIICHAEGYKLGIASNHGDVLTWFNKFGKTMANVRSDVKAAMGGVSVKEETTTAKKLYRVRKSWADSKSQVGAYSSLDNAKKEANKHPGYSVYDDSGKCVYKSTSTSTSTATAYYPKYTGKATSLDTILAAIGVPDKFRGSWAKRKPLAQAQGISNYSGKTSENIKLADLAKQGKLKKVL